MNKKIIGVFIGILFCGAGYNSVCATYIDNGSKVFSPFIPTPNSINVTDVSFFQGGTNQRAGYVPHVEPLYVDDTIVSLIERLDEAVIREYLEALTSFGPRVTTTEACDSAGEYIFNEFVNMGLTTRYHYWDAGSSYGNNIEATIDGYDDTTDDIYIICAHYDSVEDSPGADDDGSGVAAVMSAAQLMRNYKYKNTIKFVAFSGEEQGLYGSHYYVEEAVNNNVPIAGVLNLDMIGFAESEEDTLYVNVYQDTHNPNEWLTNYTINVSEEYHDYINLDIVPSGYAWGSDHYWFWNAGFNAIYYEESNFNNYYHSPEDTIDNMDLSYAVKNIKLTIATLAELTGITELQAPFQPVITYGPSEGKVGEVYNFSATTTDPQNDSISYLWDWGDKTDSGWIGPYASGIECAISNTWEKKGNYNIKVKAKDASGYESEWSDPFAISMPKKYTFDSIAPFITKMMERFPFLHSFLFTMIH